MKTFSPLRGSGARRGFTLVELVVASGVGMLIAGGGMLLLVEASKETYRGMADATVEQAASDLESRIFRCLRSMSASEGVVYTTPGSVGPGGYQGYQRIIVARGPTPDYPREELRFDASAAQAVYLPNRSISSTSQLFMNSRSNVVVLRNLCFFPSFKQDGTPDNSLVNVVVEVDDAGYARRSGSVNPARIQRTFAVKMRNN
jgi:hypothetical protein